MADLNETEKTFVAMIDHLMGPNKKSTYCKFIEKKKLSSKNLN
jgi:hypothetical protein